MNTNKQGTFVGQLAGQPVSHPKLKVGQKEQVVVVVCHDMACAFCPVLSGHYTLRRHNWSRSLIHN